MNLQNLVFVLSVSFYTKFVFCAVINNSNIKESAHSEELVSSNIEELDNLAEHGHQMDPSVKEKRCRESPQYDFYDNVVGSVRQIKPQTFTLPLALKRREIQSDFLKKQCETCRESPICKISKKCELCNKLCKDYSLDIKVRSAASEEKLVGNPLQEETGLSEFQDRYYSVGSFGPGPTQSLLARLLNIPKNVQLERLIVLAKNKSKSKPNSLPHPVIIDTAHVFSINDGRPAEFDVEVHDVNGKDDDLERLTSKLNKDLDAAIQTKKKMLSDSHLTPQEIDKIIEHAISQRNGVLSKVPFVGDTNKQLPRLDGDRKKLIQEEAVGDPAASEMNLEGFKKKKDHKKKHGFVEGLVGEALPAIMEENQEIIQLGQQNNLEHKNEEINSSPNESNNSDIKELQVGANLENPDNQIQQNEQKDETIGSYQVTTNEGLENKKEILESKFKLKKKKEKAGSGGYRENEDEDSNDQELEHHEEKNILESKLNLNKKGDGYDQYREIDADNRKQVLTEQGKDKINPHSRSNVQDYENGLIHPATSSQYGYAPAPVIRPQQYQSAPMDQHSVAPGSQTYVSDEHSSKNYKPNDVPSENYAPVPNVLTPSDSSNYEPETNPNYASSSSYQHPDNTGQISYQAALPPSPPSTSYQPEMPESTYQAQKSLPTSANYQSQSAPQHFSSYAPLNSHPAGQNYQQEPFLENNQQYQATNDGQYNQKYEDNNQQYENNDETVEKQEQENEKLSEYALVEPEEPDYKETMHIPIQPPPMPQSDNQYQGPVNNNYQQASEVAPPPVQAAAEYPTASTPANGPPAIQQSFSVPSHISMDKAPISYDSPATAYNVEPAAPPLYSETVPAPVPPMYQDVSPTTDEKINYKPNPQGAYYQTDDSGKSPVTYEEFNGKGYQPPGTYKQPNNEYKHSFQEENDEDVLVPIELDEELPVFGQISDGGKDYTVGAAKQNNTNPDNKEKVETIAKESLQDKGTNGLNDMISEGHNPKLRENWFEEKYHQLRQWVEENVGMEQDVQNETLGSEHKAIVDEFTNIIKNDLVEGRNITNSTRKALEEQISTLIEDDLKSENITAPRLAEELNKIESIVDKNKDSIVNLQNLEEFKSRFISIEQKEELKKPESLLGGIARALNAGKKPFKNIHDSLLGDKWNVVDVNNFGESSTISTSSILPKTSRKPLIDIKSIVNDLKTLPNLVFNRAEKVADILQPHGNRMPPVQTLPGKSIESSVENIIPAVGQRNQENTDIGDSKNVKGNDIKESETVGQSLKENKIGNIDKSLVEGETGDNHNDTVGCSLEDLLEKSSEEKMYLKPILGGYGYRDSNNKGLHLPTIKELLHPHKKSHELEKLEELLTPHESRSDGDSKNEKSTILPPLHGIPELIKDLENLHVTLPPLPTLKPHHKHHPTPIIPKIEVNDEEYNPENHKNQLNENINPQQVPLNYPPNSLPIPQPPPQQYQFRNFQQENPQFQQNFQEFPIQPQNFQSAARNAESNHGYSEMLGAAPIQTDRDMSHFGKIVPAELHDLNIHSRDVSEQTKAHKMYFVGDGIKLPLHMKKHDDGTLHLSVDVNKLCKCNQTDCTNKTQENEPHFLDTAVGSENNVEEDFDDPAVGMAAPDLGTIHSQLEEKHKTEKKTDEVAIDKDLKADKDIFKRSPDFALSDKGDIPEFRPRFNNYYGEEYDHVIPIRNIPKPNLENLRSFHDGIKRYYENEHEGYKLNVAENNNLEHEREDVIQKRVGLLTNVLSWMKGIAMEKAKY